VATSRVRDLKEFGTGTLQYFYVVRTLATVFGALALLAAIPMVGALGRRAR